MFEIVGGLHLFILLGAVWLWFEIIRQIVKQFNKKED